MQHEGPSYEGVCSLTVSEASCQANTQSNLAVLTAVAALDQGMTTLDESDSRSAEIQQLDNKLNVLIQMFAGFWRQQSDLPVAIPVSLSASGICIGPGALQIPDQAKCLQLYLHEALPLALELPIKNVEKDASGAYFLSFDDMSEDLSDALSRHVFRHHRRGLAQQRKASNLHCEEK